MNLTTLKQSLICLLLIVAIVCGVNLWWNSRLLMRELMRGSTAVSDFAVFQTEQLQSDKTQKVLNANLELGAAAKGTIQAFNRLIIPRLMQNLDSSNAALIELKGTVRSGGNLLANTDNTINQQMLPEMTAILHGLRLLTENEVKETVIELLATGKNLRVITDSAELKNLPVEVNKLAQSLNRSAGSMEVIFSETERTAGNLSGITGNLNAISKDSADKVRSLLNPAPAPFWKKYILYPLREVGGVAYLLVKITNGL